MQTFHQHAVLEAEANQIRASILDMAHCIRTFTEEVSEYSRKLVGIVQQIEGGEQIVEDSIGMAHTEHVWASFSCSYCICNLNKFPLNSSLVFTQVPGTAESARSCVRAYFADLHETLCRQEEMALSVVDAHVRERLIWLRQQQEDMTILLSQVSTACLHCEKTLQQVQTRTPDTISGIISSSGIWVGLLLCFPLGRLQGGFVETRDQPVTRDTAETAAAVYRAGWPHSTGCRHPCYFHQGNLTFLCHSKVSSACKISCGAVIHDI